MSSDARKAWLERETQQAIAREAGIEAPDLLATLASGESFDAARERFERRVQRWSEENPERAEEIRRTAPAEAARQHEARIRERLAKDSLQASDRRRRWVVATGSGVGERTGRVISGGRLQETKALTAAREWASGGSGFLLLLGVRGVGKTVAAAEAMVALTGREIDACFCDACNANEPSEGCLVGDGHFARARKLDLGEFAACPCLFVKAGRLSGALHDEGGEDLWRRARQMPVLVIDDLGREYADMHGRWASELDLLIDDRHEAMRRTVITSNLSADEFKQRYGERIADRVRQDGRVVVCTGESLRRAG